MTTISADLLRSEIARFVIVGTSAAAVHFCCVLFQVEILHWQPLLANVLAFLVAFIVSYSGHRFWTFADITLDHAQSLPRFFLIASTSFALNEVMYYCLLKYTPLPYWLSLGIVLLLVAVLTFVSGRLWAFARQA